MRIPLAAGECWIKIMLHAHFTALKRRTLTADSHYISFAGAFLLFSMKLRNCSGQTWEQRARDVLRTCLNLNAPFFQSAAR